ncbi:hypothetical protein [Rhizobium sp. CSW-27]|uniref:hypothetical protein n=1 Tax=Rhizobium sp. CSW-27 TaxID=2839985 RepID=UPI001C021A30|nr:hypothetical protein [Rhizobium sp. CSW-27]MBT9369435.1 hypothetical protein [Rhizobium sp. CSW-27]
MAHLDPEQQEDEPLDPVLENVRRKMVRLQLVSGGIMFISLMAVLIAVVYKVRSQPAPVPAAVTASAGFSVPADQPLSATVHLPPGFAVQSVSQSGSQILFYGSINGVRKVMIFDLSVGRVIADLTVAER